MFIYQNPKDLFYVAHKHEESPNIKHFFGHSHEHHEIFLFIQGNASFNIEGNIFKLSPFDIVMIPPQQYHCLILDSISKYERYVLEIPPKYLNSDYRTVFSAPTIFNIADNSSLVSLFSRLDAYHNMLSGEDFASMCQLLVRECMLLLKTSLIHRSVEHSYDPLTKRMLTYINENITLPLSAELLSEHFFLSKSHVQNVFHQNMKIGMKQYITQKKMLLAKELLQKGKKPYEVAEHLSYKDYTTFFKNFKRHYRLPPQAFSPKNRMKPSS